MRTLLSCSAALILATASVASLQPSITQAAVTKATRSADIAYGYNRTVVGYLASNPTSYDLSSPVTIMLQTGGMTPFPVQVTAQTQIVNRSGRLIPFTAITTPAQLQVTGLYTGSSINARVIRNLSINTVPVPPPSSVSLQLNGGTLSAAVSAGASYLCVVGGQVTVPQMRSLVPPTNPCTNGAPVYVNGSTVYRNQNGASIAVTDLFAGDVLNINANLANSGPNAGQLTATLVTDITPHAISTPVQIGGTLGAAVSAGATYICVIGAQVTQARTFAPLITVCPSGQLPVYVNGSTQYFNNNGAAINVTDLLAGDSLNIAANLVNSGPNAGQVIATRITDTTVRITSTPIKVTGTLGAAVSAGASYICVIGAQVTQARTFAPLITVCPSGQLPVYVNGSTLYRDYNGAGIAITDLVAGDSLTINANLVNSGPNAGQVTATLVNDNTAHAGLTIVDGTIVAVPAPSGPFQPVNLLVQSGGRTALIQINSRTALTDSRGRGLSLSSLFNGDHVKITGVMNNGQLVAVTLVDYSR